MSILSLVKPPRSLTLLAFSLSLISLHGQEPSSPALSAQELASQMDANFQGNALIRSQMEIHLPNGGKRVMQLQIKQRRTKTASDLSYRVLWPNEYRDQVVILHQDAGKAPTGSATVPHQPVRNLASSQMGDGLLESDLSYQDAIENVYNWKYQAIVGTEVINGVTCQILESKPDNSSVSIYAKARSWIDPRRLVPLRIEKYSTTDKLERRIDITRVARDEKHHPIPAGLTVRNPGKNSTTDFNGASINQDVSFTDSDFASANIVP